MYDIKSSFDSQGQVSIFPLKSYTETRFLLPSKKCYITLKKKKTLTLATPWQVGDGRLDWGKNKSYKSKS